MNGGWRNKISLNTTDHLSGNKLALRSSHHRNLIMTRHYVTKQSVPRWWWSCWECRWLRDSLWNSLRPQTHGTQTRHPQPQTCVLEGPRKIRNLQSLIEPLQGQQKIPVKLKLVSQRMYQEQEAPSLPSKAPQHHGQIYFYENAHECSNESLHNSCLLTNTTKLSKARASDSYPWLPHYHMPKIPFIFIDMWLCNLSNSRSRHAREKTILLTRLVAHWVKQDEEAGG